MSSSSPLSRALRVELRSSLAERLGRSVVILELPPEAQAQDVRTALARRHPAAAALIESALVVADDRVLGRRDALPAVDAVALIPPVSGG